MSPPHLRTLRQHLRILQHIERELVFNRTAVHDQQVPIPVVVEIFKLNPPPYQRLIRFAQAVLGCPIFEETIAVNQLIDIERRVFRYPVCHE